MITLSGTGIGILSGLPVVLFGIAALPGSLLIARFGACATLVAGLVIAGRCSACAALLRRWWLYAATIVMSAGIAIMQPALPALVRQWLPQTGELRHRAVHQWAPGRRNVAGDVDAARWCFPLVGRFLALALAFWGVPLC